jgi:multidrug efflux system membrane fusion protein
LKSVFNNEDNALFPNQFVNVHLLVDTKHNLTIVPAAAIQRGPQGTYVYAVATDNTAKIHTVTIAQTTGNNIGLSDGLNAGDVVVIDGADKLQDGSKVIPNASTGGAGGGRKGGAQPSAQDGSQSPSPAKGQTGSQAQGSARGKSGGSPR